MANDEDLDLSGDDSEDAGAPGSGGGKGKLIVIIAAVLLLGGGGAAFFLLGGNGEAVEKTAVEGENASIKEEVAEPAQNKAAAIYVAIPNGILAQIPSGKKMTTLQIQIDFLVRSQDVAEALTKDMPLIENDLLLFFSAANVDEIKTVEGKNKLRQGALKIVQKIIQKKIGKPGVEKVLFSGFVMQR